LTEKLLRAEDVGSSLGITRSGVYNLAKCGVLACVKFKTRGDRFTIRFRQQDLDSFIRGHLCDGRSRVEASV
jgi:predicted DNA-binding transcriptional regulator AlpA